jgi:drug/metabolite transporter (DMT)-like permease
VRRLATTTDLLLLTTVVIWALNISVTKYILTHGFLPLAYSSVRYGIAAVVFLGLALSLERSLRIGARRDRIAVAGAAVAIWVNQVCFVYAVKLTTATTVALIFGTIPIFTALLSSLVGLERLTGRVWFGGAFSFGGVALVAVGSGGELSADLGGDLLAIATAATWAAYSVTIAPLLRTYSPTRISAVILPVMWVPLALTSIGQLGEQDFGSLSTSVWLLAAFSALAPLVLTNVLWFTAIDRVGPSHATLFTNIQPFIAAVFAVFLLDESLSVLQIVGGLLIAVGILLSRFGARAREAVPAPME